VTEVRPLKSNELPDAARVIAYGMADNPIHVAVWPDPEVRAAALITTCLLGLQRPMRWALGAVEGKSVVGIAGIAPEGSCRPTVPWVEDVTRRLSALDAGSVERYWAWRRAWAECDPDQPHWHFGPFAVDRKSTRLNSSHIL